jgi:hypothetical protein
VPIELSDVDQHDNGSAERCSVWGYRVARVDMMLVSEASRVGIFMSTFVANDMRYKSNRLPLTRIESAADRRVAALAVKRTSAAVVSPRLDNLCQHQAVVKLSR